ncbi:UDP-N-acetyl-D-mannosamine dehydrogenase [Actinomyces minihominis]|uniref:UDP-N-acetyl-D-mannosamine dehydrogenase n=1 Tax=Actinomyces minihominis TaxID=2002838 RepID=UPI000C06EC3B|nr:UDP-N-acetyl-D-mannosamine dehydrogenase [Actinomyces minihominis]
MVETASGSNGTVTVVGLGYIGLPTAVVLADNGWQVTGVDISDRTVEMVNRGELPFVEEGMDVALAEAVRSGRLKARKDTPKSDIFIVSVPTPFKGDHEADLSYIDAAVDGIAPQLVGDELIVLESTSPPGATEHMADRVLAARPDLSADGSNGRPVIHFAHAPERVLPGRIMIEMTANDRVIGGLTPEAGIKAKEVYETFCNGEVSVTDAKTAEMAKLTENAFRDVNIAFANELSLIADKMGIDVWELIELANKHPRVNILSPGPGVGGHCIAVDPWFIVSSDRENSNLVRTAREVNDGKPAWVISKVEEAMKTAGPEASVALLGLAFKPNIDDLRESPAMNIAIDLVSAHPDRTFYISEPFIEELPAKLANFKNVVFASPEDAIKAEVVVLLVDHDPFIDLDQSLFSSKFVIDTRGVWR